MELVVGEVREHNDAPSVGRESVYRGEREIGMSGKCRRCRWEKWQWYSAARERLALRQLRLFRYVSEGQRWVRSEQWM